MSRLPKEIRNSLQEEAKEWDITIPGESPEQVQRLLDKAKPFNVQRPARQPISLRLDPFDISMIKRLAHKKGITHSQLMAIWLHERIEEETQVVDSK